MSENSFVDVRRLQINYPLPQQGVLRWLGRAPAAIPALRSISLQLNQGDQVAVFGFPGSGKTTLLRALTGILKSTSGRVLVNNVAPQENADAAAGYVSSEEAERQGDTVYDTLHSFGVSHGITSLPTKLNDVITQAGLEPARLRPASSLSTTERLRLNTARAALSDAPLILLDDVADELGADVVSNWLAGLLAHRTTVIATRQAVVAEALDLPIYLLHNGIVAQSGTRDEIALAVAAPRVVDVWIEGLRYDIFRKLKKHTGVASVRLIPDGRFNGQRLRIELRSGRYLPSLYDLVSASALVKVTEIPPSLADIVDRL